MSNRARGEKKSNKSGIPEVDNYSGEGEFGELTEAMVEDPIFRVLYEWRVPLITVALLVLAGFYIRGQIDKAYVQSQQSAAGIYAELDEEFRGLEGFTAELEKISEELKAIPEGEKPEERKELLERQSRLQESYEKGKGVVLAKIAALKDEREPYSAVASGYEAVLSLENGESPVSYPNWENTDASASSRVFLELTALRLARAALSSDKDSEARLQLNQLVMKGRFAHVGAALSLARVAEDEGQKQEALKLLEELSLRAPEQNELLEAELDRLRQ